mgnify:FL=1
MIVGDRASDDHAVNEAIELAELLGLPVYQSRGAEVAFPTTHPQFMGNLSLRVADHREILKRVDLVLTVGMDTFEELFYWGDPILNQDVKLIHIDPVPGKVGKSEPVSVGIISHCKLALNELIKTVKPLLNDKSNEIISKRKNTISKEFEESQKTYEESLSAKWNQSPMIPARMMYEIANAVPENAVILDDSISNRAALRYYFKPENRGDLRAVRGQSIGGGIGATIGNQCAYPDRTVFGIIGDGSAMMTIQGLWTAANDNIPCVFIICNNGMYRVLKVNFNVYQKDILDLPETAGANLLYSDFNTPFDMAAIANSMGVSGTRITKPEEIKPAIDKAVASGKPALLDIVIDGSL